MLSRADRPEVVLHCPLRKNIEAKRLRKSCEIVTQHTKHVHWARFALSPSTLCSKVCTYTMKQQPTVSSPSFGQNSTTSTCGLESLDSILILLCAMQQYSMPHSLHRVATGAQQYQRTARQSSKRATVAGARCDDCATCVARGEQRASASSCVYQCTASSRFDSSRHSVQWTVLVLVNFLSEFCTIKTEQQLPKLIVCSAGTLRRGYGLLTHCCALLLLLQARACAPPFVRSFFPFKVSERERHVFKGGITTMRLCRSFDGFYWQT